jgi:uncharacterized protein (TIGR03086 family)
LLRIEALSNRLTGEKQERHLSVDARHHPLRMSLSAARRAAVAIDGDLGPVAVDVTARAMALWRTDGILDAVHATPFGELPGCAVIDFAIIDAAAHSWDLSTSVGRPLEFDPAHIPLLADVVAATCTDAAREHGLINPPTEVPADATDTERLMSAAGRAIRR